ncbi:hypothetical protein [Nonomuraea basaltis]|uniref:hypothetical protein n=1 Tax=Nonomuraea basaltis TaxID=2495887 RepID=UPI00110C68BF|nr:hypothetical protein [Nonomuraea basaltis]TMS00140.1 hypothetical protein EJK15_03450 [Nonomuraea basaltis]
MGVSMYPGRASWSYSGFGSFRDRLAQAEGFDLREMAGFAPFDAPEDWTGKPWDTVHTTLEPLLNHSDCDGYLDAYECEQVIPRLRQIIATWPESDYDRQHGEALIKGMEHCVEHGCSMRFA